MDNLKTVYFEVTNRCNKMCKHCFNGKINNTYNSELDLLEIKNIIDQLCEMDIEQVKIVGGEPMIRNDIYEIFAYLEAKKINFMVFTDSDTIADNIMKLKSFRYLREVRISIDGNELVHDQIRKIGDFKKLLFALEKLKSSDVNVIANYTINKMNLDCIEEIYDLMKHFKIEIKFGLIKLCDSVLENELMFEKKEINRFFEKLGKIQDTNQELFDKIVFDIQDNRGFIENQKKSVGKIGCYAGEMSCVVDSKGNMWPCGMLKGNNNFKYGNALVDGVEKCWKRMNNIWVNIQADYECERCSYAAQCTGGCRANSIFSNGHINGKDPNCYFYCNSIAKVLNGIKENENNIKS